MRAQDAATPSILSILPKNEGFSPARAGAIALCARDFTRFSRYREQITVLGGDAGGGFDGAAYEAILPARWHEHNLRAYARGCVRAIHTHGAALAEIHNRPRLPALIAKQAACRLALHLHNDPQAIDGARSPDERRALLARCDAVYCVSQYVRGRFLEGLGDAPAHKLHVVYNGIDIPSELPAKEPLIIYAGRMSAEKGAPLLAEALALALPQLPGSRAMLIGSHRHAQSGKPTALEARIAATLAPLGDRAELTGFRTHEETLRCFSRAAVAVVPSLWQEPFGRTALEAMACGAALISSGRGGLREVTGDAALTLSEMTAQSLADALLRLARNAGLREKLQQAGRARAREFSAQHCTAALDRLRENILNAAQP